jgi:hypothetical protein
MNYRKSFDLETSQCREAEPQCVWSDLYVLGYNVIVASQTLLWVMYLGTRHTILAATWIHCICVLIADPQCRLRGYHL